MRGTQQCSGKSKPGRNHYMDGKIPIHSQHLIVFSALEIVLSSKLSMGARVDASPLKQEEVCDTAKRTNQQVMRQGCSCIIGVQRCDFLFGTCSGLRTTGVYENNHRYCHKELVEVPSCES